MFFKTYWILGQNARNLVYIKWLNDEFAKKLADSKLKTKEFLKTKWVSIVKTLFIVKNHEELADSIFEKLKPPFVIKPNNWFWWKWIIVFDSKTQDGKFVTNSWTFFTKEKLFYHFRNILDGFFSMSWFSDKIIIEKKIILNNEVELLWRFGLPDIRIIVFNMVPIMAMLRVPTKESDWKANLHAWACWVWIDIWTWRLTYITKSSKIAKSVPDIWDIRGIKIPNWEEILSLAVKVQQVTRIWYLWCDIVLDQNDWPILLEMNVRSGLEVQLANMSPLKERLEKVEWVNINSVEKWVRLWRDLFSWDIEEKIKNISWKKILWVKEYLTIQYNNKTYKYLSKIKTSQTYNYISKDFLYNVLKIKKNELTSWYIKLKVKLLSEDKNLKFIVKELSWVNIILWLNSLKGFLIDPFKCRRWEVPISKDFLFLKWKNVAIKQRYEEQLLKIDKEIVSIDKKLIVLKHISPKNIFEEKEKFIKSGWKYLPKFQYSKINLDLKEIEEKINKLEIPDIPLSSIYILKKEEILNKINLLSSFESGNHKNFVFYSTKLYWDIIPENFEYSKNVISSFNKIKKEKEFLSSDEIKAYINKFNHIYGIKIKFKKWSWVSRFVMKWDTLIFSKWFTVWKKEMRSIIAHEIEWHYLRSFNWRSMKYSIFSRWTSWYLQIDEGIAIYNQNRFLWPNDKKYYSIFKSYFFINYALKNSYKNLVSKMIDYYGGDLERVFTWLLRLKRWFKDISEDGCFMKDVVYVNGFLEVSDYINSSWDLKELYLWKISIKDLKMLKDSYFVKLNFKDLKTPFFL